MLPLLLAWAAVLQDVEALRKAGEQLLKAEDCKGALLKFEKALAAAPHQADLYVGRGRALMGLELYEDSEQDFNRALELDPALTLAYYFRGQIRSYRNAHKEALADYDQCLERGVRDPQILGFKGLSLNKLGRHVEAEGLFSRQLLEPNPPALAYIGRALARLAQGNLRGAISDETRSIELDPAVSDDYLRRGLAYFGEESWDNALRDLRKVVELEKKVGDFAAHWIFLCRCRMGQKEAAIQELRGFVKSTSDHRDASSWSTHLFALDLGEMSGEKLLELAKENSQRAAAHFAIATRYLMDGKSEDAVTHLQKASKFPMLEGAWGAALADAQLRRLSRVRVDRLSEELEAKFRALPLFEATYEVDLRWLPEEEMAIRTLVWTTDLKGKETRLSLTGKNLQRKSDFTTWFLMKENQLYTWKESDDGFCRLDLSFMPKLVADIEQEVARLGPAFADAISENDSIPALALNLEGKPSKDGEGTIRFGIGMAGSPCSWLNERPGAEDVLREDKDEVIFEFPARRKKVVIDRHTGLLKALETLDYDGTRRTIRLVSYKPIAAWPKIHRPQKERPFPYDVDGFRDRMIQQESIFQAEIAFLVDKWDEVVRAKKEDQATGILTRWAAQYSDGFHAHAIRAQAGRRIQEALNLGTPLSVLVQQAEADARQFAAQVAEHRKVIDDFLKSNLAELAERTETGLFERLIDSRLHASARALVKKALDPQVVERRRKATFGDRLEQLYREELATRGGL